jgi:hypothetical protein
MNERAPGFVKYPKANRFNSPPSTPAVEDKLKRIYYKIKKVIGDYHPTQYDRNLTDKENKTLNSLRDKPFIFLPSDKGGEFCVIEENIYTTLGMEHLSDTNTYRKIEHMMPATIEKKINLVWKTVCKRRKLKPHIAASFTSNNTEIPKFYHLIKTHKPGSNLKIRPIVSNVNGPTTRIAWLLSFLLKPLLVDVPAHLESSKTLMQRIQQLDPDVLRQYPYPCSLDVVALYTSIPPQDAITSIIDKLEYNLFNYYGLRTDDIKELLEVVLRNTYLQFNGHTFLQVKGLAMGSSVSGILAIVFMDYLEKKALLSFTHIGLYGRYVDDIFALVINRDEAEKLQTTMNQQHSSIAFELELPDSNNSLSLLDFNVQLTNGETYFRFYKKAARKDIFVNFGTALSFTSKITIAANERVRITERCSSEEQKEIYSQKLDQLLRKNGFTADAIQLTRARQRRQHREVDKVEPFYFHIPFISDKVNNRIKRIFLQEKLDIRLYHLNTSLRNRLAKRTKELNTCTIDNCITRPTNQCFKRNVVYEVKCNKCHKAYIGSTIRHLHTRIIEHLRTDRNSSIFKHIETCQNSDNYSIRTLAQDRDVINLRIREGILIHERKPQINSRDELSEFKDFLIQID